jgi:hypothetical protein
MQYRGERAYVAAPTCIPHKFFSSRYSKYRKIARKRRVSKPGIATWLFEGFQKPQPYTGGSLGFRKRELVPRREMTTLVEASSCQNLNIVT